MSPPARPASPVYAGRAVVFGVGTRARRRHTVTAGALTVLMSTI